MSEWTGRTIANQEDVARAIAESPGSAAIGAHQLTRHDRAGTSALAQPVQTADEAELTPDRSRLLPALPALQPVLPWPGGLLRGATVAAVGSTSLVLALLVGAMSEGSWAAVVGLPWLSGLAASDFGVPLKRLALVPDPGPDWPTVVGALIDGVDMVVLRATGDEATIRSPQARAREKGCVLVSTRVWPGADLVFQQTSARWEGLRQGGGRLRYQRAEFTVPGRGRAARQRRLELIFPPPPAHPRPRSRSRRHGSGCCCSRSWGRSASSPHRNASAGRSRWTGGRHAARRTRCGRTSN